MGLNSLVLKPPSINHPRDNNPVIACTETETGNTIKALVLLPAVAVLLQQQCIGLGRICTCYRIIYATLAFLSHFPIRGDAVSNLKQCKNERAASSRYAYNFSIRRATDDDEVQKLFQ